jgi:hypothetical protein
MNDHGTSREGGSVTNDAYHVKTTRSYRLKNPLVFLAALASVAIVVLVTVVLMLW